MRTCPVLLLGTKELEEAVACLIRFLADKRQKSQRLLQILQQNNDSFSYNHQDQEDEIEEQLRILEVVDTALLKSYMLSNERLVGSLLRVTNHCNLEETENLLLKHKVHIATVSLSSPFI